MAALTARHRPARRPPTGHRRCGSLPRPILIHHCTGPLFKAQFWSQFPLLAGAFLG